MFSTLHQVQAGTWSTCCLKGICTQSHQFPFYYELYVPFSSWENSKDPKCIMWISGAVSLIKALYCHKAELITLCSKYFSMNTLGEFLVPPKTVGVLPFTSVGCISPFVFNCQLVGKGINYTLLNPSTVIINKSLKKKKCYHKSPFYLAEVLESPF